MLTRLRSKRRLRQNEGPSKDEVPKKRSKTTMFLKFESSDGAIIKVSYNVAKVSILLSTMIENMGFEDSDDPRLQEPIPLEISGDMMKKVMDFCTRYRNREYVPMNLRTTRTVKLDAWDMKYMDVDEGTFAELFNAANYMNVPGLMEILAQKVADSMENFTVEELRDAFGVENDFTPEEEDKLKAEYAWKVSEWC